MNNLDYGKVFEVLVKETANYVKVNNLRAMVLGISGGIDSTVVAAICHGVITVGGIANARNSIFKLMKSNLISSNVLEECVTDKEFINFNDTY